LTAAEESLEAGLEGVLPPDFSASARSSFRVSSHKSIAEWTLFVANKSWFLNANAVGI
jgi:hypothetical protein